jgi:1-deoxyxylulose-5-phosphate synthase
MLVGTVVWSPLARGRLSRPWDAALTARSGQDGFADMLYTPATKRGDQAVGSAHSRGS